MIGRRWDWVLSAALVGTGALLRFWNLGGAGLTHFDEGSYTMAGRWLATLGKEGWAIQAGHSPPLFPAMLGISFSLFGFSDTAAIAVSAAVGSATIGAVYYLGRIWMGWREGLLAALFLATSEYHLIYSRMALTDVTFTLLFWAALGALYQAARSGERRWAMAAGVLTGLCWNTKYHGFFPLLIFLFWLLMTARRQGGWKSRLKQSKLWMAAAIALLAFLPWVAAVQWTTGYAAILAGQLGHAWDLSPFSRTTPAILAFYLRSWMSALLLATSAAGLAWSLKEQRPGQLFVVWTGAFFAASTFLYMSFPRLALPLVPALCLLAGLGAVRLSGLAPSNWRKPLLAGLAAAVIAANLWHSVPLLEMRTDAYRKAAAYLVQQEGLALSQLNKNYYFYESGFKSRPPSFELRWQDLPQTDRLIEASASTIIAVDPIRYRLPEVEEWFEKQRPRLRLLRRFKIEAYAPVYFQGIDPAQEIQSQPRSLAPFIPGESWIEVYRR